MQELEKNYEFKKMIILKMFFPSFNFYKIQNAVNWQTSGLERSTQIKLCDLERSTQTKQAKQHGMMGDWK